MAAARSTASSLRIAMKVRSHRRQRGSLMLHELRELISAIIWESLMYMRREKQIIRRPASSNAWIVPVMCA